MGRHTRGLILLILAVLVFAEARRHGRRTTTTPEPSSSEEDTSDSIAIEKTKNFVPTAKKHYGTRNISSTTGATVSTNNKRRGKASTLLSFANKTSDRSVSSHATTKSTASTTLTNAAGKSGAKTIKKIDVAKTSGNGTKKSLGKSSNTTTHLPHTHNKTIAHDWSSRKNASKTFAHGHHNATTNSTSHAAHPKTRTSLSPKNGTHSTSSKGSKSKPGKTKATKHGTSTEHGVASKSNVTIATTSKPVTKSMGHVVAKNTTISSKHKPANSTAHSTPKVGKKTNATSTSTPKSKGNSTNVTKIPKLHEKKGATKSKSSTKLPTAVSKGNSSSAASSNTTKIHSTNHTTHDHATTVSSSKPVIPKLSSVHKSANVTNSTKAASNSTTKSKTAKPKDKVTVAVPTSSSKKSKSPTASGASTPTIDATTETPKNKTKPGIFKKIFNKITGLRKPKNATATTASPTTITNAAKSNSTKISSVSKTSASPTKPTLRIITATKTSKIGNTTAIPTNNSISWNAVYTTLQTSPSFDYIVVDKASGFPCILSTMSISMKIFYVKTDGTLGQGSLTVPKSARSNGTCNVQTSHMNLTWTPFARGKGYVPNGGINSVVLNFVKNGSKSTLDSVNFAVHLDKENFPKAAKSIITANTMKNLKLFSSTANRGHLICNMVTNLIAGDINAKITNVSLIAFNKNKNVSSTTEENCIAESGIVKAAIIGGVVGSVVLVSGLGVYLWRRNSNPSESSTLP